MSPNPAEAPGALTHVPILVCADRHILHGLHVTLFSALKHSSVRLQIHLLHNGLGRRELVSIEETCRRSGKPFDLEAHHISDAPFQRLKPLVGNKFTYARFLIGDYISDAPKAIYLDSDLFVALDLKKLFLEDLKGKAIGASGTGRARTALEREVYARMGFDGEARVFNAGVLVIDLDRWRGDSMKERAFEIAASLMVHDQPALNILVRGDFAELDPKYNLPLDPRFWPTGELDEGIYHFIGRPKPWDPFASLLHGSYKLYSSASRLTAAPSMTVASRLTPRTAWRILRLSRSYWRCLKARRARISG